MNDTKLKEQLAEAVDILISLVDTLAEDNRSIGVNAITGFLTRMPSDLYKELHQIIITKQSFLPTPDEWLKAMTGKTSAEVDEMFKGANWNPPK